MQVVELVRKYIDRKGFWELPLDYQKQELKLLFTDICDLCGVDGGELVVDVNAVM